MSDHMVQHSEPIQSLLQPQHSLEPEQHQGSHEDEFTEEDTRELDTHELNTQETFGRSQRTIGRSQQSRQQRRMLSLISIACVGP